MKIETSKLTGAALDWAVAKAESPRVCPVILAGRVYHDTDWDHIPYSPSTDWALGGPIIERERISVGPNENSTGLSTKWVASIVDFTTTPVAPLAWDYGPSILITTMRCYVTEKLGDEVEIPKELL